VRTAGDMMEAVASEKPIIIGPVDDENYILDPDSGRWFDSDGYNADFLPHECTLKHEDGKVIIEDVKDEKIVLFRY
jgi:hypothetical protein